MSYMSWPSISSLIRSYATSTRVVPKITIKVCLREEKMVSHHEWQRKGRTLLIKRQVLKLLGGNFDQNLRSLAYEISSDFELLTFSKTLPYQEGCSLNWEGSFSAYLSINCGFSF